MKRTWVIEHLSFGVFMSIDGGNTGGPYFSPTKPRYDAFQFEDVNQAIRYLDQLQATERYRYAYIRSNEIE